MLPLSHTPLAALTAGLRVALPIALASAVLVGSAVLGSIALAPAALAAQEIGESGTTVRSGGPGKASGRTIGRAAGRRGPAAVRFTLASPDLAAGGPIGDAHVFNGFGCSGQNVSPALVWRGAPAGTRSFAVTVYDPDAPTGSGWWHWVLYNLPATVTTLPAGAGDPKGSTAPVGAVQGTTDFGTAGYGGPCPPIGDRPHRYVFTVHALKVDKLDLPATATAAFVGFNLNANRLASASFTARYGR